MWLRYDSAPGSSCRRKRSNPRHSTTGTRGYFGYAESVFDRSQSEKLLPRVLRITRW
jgi:hypothetical protein